MNACSTALGPALRPLEAIVAPEQLLPDQERGSAEDAARLRVRSLPLQPILDVRVADGRENLLGIKV